MKTTKMAGFLGKTLFVITLISCSEEIGPCYSIEQQCKALEQKMNAATGAEKEQYRQKLLSEKHLLQNCYNSQ